MSLLAPFASPASSSVHVGLRVLVRSSQRHLPGSVAGPARKLSTTARRHTPTFQWSCSRIPSPANVLRQAAAPPSGRLLPRTQIRSIFRFRAITHYNKLPLSYEDSKGLPFRKEDLNQREIKELFGPHISAERANQLLRIIHGRRVAGTLDDPSLQVNTDNYRTADKIKALEYLREHIPLDEVIMAGLRAEDELKALEEEQGYEPEEGQEQSQEVQAQMTAAPEPPVEEEEVTAPAPTGRLPRREDESPYGESELDRVRKENIAKREAEEARLEEERIKREEEEALGNIGTLQTQQAAPREVSPWIQKHREEATSDLEAPPEMPSWRRLLPSVGFALLICATAALYATYYQPPRKSWRLFPDIPPAAATCLALIGLNVGVFLLWKAPPAWKFLNKYFLVVAATPRPLQLVGAMFSHQTFSHLAFNMVALWFFGTRIHDEIGRGNFLALYFSSGVLGFAASLTDLVLRRGLQYTTHGASGAVYGLIIAFFWMHKSDEFKIFDYPPDPMSGPQGLTFIGLILGLHIVSMMSKRRHSIDIASHLAGMAVGLGGIDLIRKHMDAKARMRAEKMKTMGMLDKAATVTVVKGSPPPADSR